MIILLGGTGYVGHAFSHLFKSRNLPFEAISRFSCDYSNPETLRTVLRERKADFIVNCAGYTGKPNVDACESNKQQCLDGNALLPGVVKSVCDELGIAWGHVSSGCIFTGDKGLDGNGTPDGFREDDVPNFSFRQNNCSFYSGTKALGEEIVGYQEVLQPDGHKKWQSKNVETGYIWRLRIPFNQHSSPRNYLTKVMSYRYLLEARNSLSQLDEFVRACWECREKNVPFGIYNVTNPGTVTTHEVVELILESTIGQKLKTGGKQFEFFKNEEEFMKLAALTPRSNCVLDTTKLAGTGIIMTPVHEAVIQSLRDWKEI